MWLKTVLIITIAFSIHLMMALIELFPIVLSTFSSYRSPIVRTAPIRSPNEECNQNQVDIITFCRYNREWFHNQNQLQGKSNCLEIIPINCSELSGICLKTLVVSFEVFANASNSRGSRRYEKVPLHLHF